VKVRSFNAATAAGALSSIWDGKAGSADANTCTARRLRKSKIIYSRRAPLALLAFQWWSSAK
jgi:hypothetical protein